MLNQNKTKDISPNRIHNRQFFYKYTSAMVAKIILTNRMLRWSSPFLFNDPFDITQELRLNFDVANLSSALAERLASLLEGDEHRGKVNNPKVAFLLQTVKQAPPAVRTKTAEELRHSIWPSTFGQIQSLSDLRRTWEEMVPTFRVLCVSEQRGLIPMWQHYADGYQGVALEFSAADEVDSAFLQARPVIYQDAPPAISTDYWIDCMMGQGAKTYGDLFTAYQYTKTSHWSYEKEWRLVSGSREGESGLYGDYGFHPKELTSIYFGPKCSSNDRADLLALFAFGLEHVKPYDVMANAQDGKFEFKPTSR